MPTRLAALIQSPIATIADIAGWLDGRSPGARWEELSTLSRAEQRTLYEKAYASAAVTLDDFVPVSVPARREVIHRGLNTLPVPGPLRRFEKRFARPQGGDGRLFGYNEGLTRRAVGPGYFVAVPTAGRPGWEARGPIVIDYFQVPDGPVPEAWPAVVGNEVGVQVLVYHHTRDFMRRVSDGVTIGAAYKEEKPLDHYFVLCRTA